MKRRNNVNPWRCDWIITVTNSENTNVNTFRFYGDKEDAAEALAAMAIEDKICDTATKEKYFEAIDDTELHQLQLIAYVDGSYENTACVYTAIEFSALNFVEGGK